MNKLTSALHDTTHQVPGVPVHEERPRGHHGGAHRARQNRLVKNGDSSQRHAARVHHHNPPRVMVGWQNWIANLFTRKTE